MTADDMAKRQRDISVAEFFAKNRHLLGFDNPKKALLTTIKEAVDNSLDACEEAGILPEVGVEIRPLKKEDRFLVAVEDNGPGIVPAQAPKIFGKLLYGSKFHSLKQARGQQGIGISAAAMYGQVTTGKPVRVFSKAGRRRPCHRMTIRIDTRKNRPVTLSNEVVEWDRPHGTRVEIELEARYQKGRQSVDDYLEQTAIANPHVAIRYRDPDGTEHRFERATKTMPDPPVEIRPHPHGVEMGVLEEMIRATSARHLSSFFRQDFSRVSPRVAEEVCAAAGVDPKASPSRIVRSQVEKLYDAIRTVRILAPPTDCVSPIGDARVLEGLAKEIEAELYVATSRRPAVYRGNPFLVEAGLAWGGDGVPAEEPIRILRFANRVPLLYQQGACAITRSVVQTDWKKYRLQQSRGAIPVGPMVLMVHIASVWVPFTSESKEAIAHYPEIIKEIKLALQECGRQLGLFLGRKRREAESARKKAYIEKYIPHIGIALREILELTDRQESRVVHSLKDVLERSRS
jgi:DNA topoisomerase-6 subunit B